MRRSLRLLIPLVLVSALIGCREIKVENGEIPDQYLPMSAKYMGSYQGEMSGVPGTLVLSLSGNKVIVEYTDARGNDLLDPRCRSQIGDLLSVKVEEDGAGGYRLQAAKFAFNPNNCWVSVQGRELVLEFKEKSSKIKTSASILESQEWKQECRIEPGNPAAGIPPRQVCDRRPVSKMIKGTFVK